jgi:ribosomal protein L37AE/L43A
MRNLRTGPRRCGLAAETREREREAVGQIMNICPKCGSKAYFPEGGCWGCRSCGYSPCK